MTSESSLRPYGNRQKWHLQKDSKANCLAVSSPEIAQNWHPSKNAPLTPYDVTPKSNKKIWWQCPVEELHVWHATVKNVANSTSEHACPYCTGKKVLPSYSLATRFPEIASQWYKTKNKDLSPFEVSPGSNKSVWWQCPINSKHVWQRSVVSRTNRPSGCPYDNLLVEQHPEIAAEWHPTRNGKTDVFSISCGADFNAWWKCSKKHVYQATIANRTAGKACPYCAGKRACKDNCLQTLHPLVAAQWHPSKNGKLTPSDVTPGSGRKAWWKCSDGHVWHSVISSVVISRVQRLTNGCPTCYLNEKSANSAKTVKGRIAADRREAAKEAVLGNDNERALETKRKSKTII